MINKVQFVDSTVLFCYKNNFNIFERVFEHCHPISLCAEIHRSVKPCQLLNSGFLSKSFKSLIVARELSLRTGLVCKEG